MKPSEDTTPARQPFPEGELLSLELKIAKRADTLWMMAGQGRGSDLMHWLQAESEVLGQYLESGALAAAER